jgi:hypothetical protein
MSVFTPEVIDAIWSLSCPEEEKAALMKALARAGQAFQPVTGLSGTTDEQERLRNASTYAERKRAKDRERQRRLREEARLSRDVAGGSRDDRATSTATEGDKPATTGDAQPSRTSAQVVNPTSSLRSEGTQEANASFVDAPSPTSTPADPEKPKTKPPKSQRGTRLPEDWEPSAEEFDLGRDAGLTDEEIHRAAVEFRNYWCSRSRDATKLSWRLTWHNRVNELGDRKRERGSRMASAPAQPGGGRRGSSSFADIYARRRGVGAG